MKKAMIEELQAQLDDHDDVRFFLAKGEIDNDGELDLEISEVIYEDNVVKVELMIA